MAQFCPEIESRIIEKANECDLEYLVEGIPRKISANLEGLERVRKIVLDLRTFSRLDEAEVKLCDLAESIASTILFLTPLAQQHEVTIKTAFAKMDPLQCSPSTLNQAVSNILSNAIQASRPGQSVLLSTMEKDDQVIICVEDHGSGISPENLSKIFDPFFTTKPVGSGTGLGLSITHQVISAQGGTLQVDSAPNQGTRMRIVLPRQH